MADNRKYYYMRLKENFFDSDNMILLESMPDGYLYTNILLKLYLRSLKDDGRLMLNGRIPYNPQMLATVTRHQIGTVEKALAIFRDLGLIEVLDNGAIYMMDIQIFIGKSSTEADRQREYQARISQERVFPEKSCKKSNKKSCKKSLPEIEIETEIETKKEIESIPQAETPKRKRFVPPTIEEVKSYCLERKNNVDPERFIDYYTANGWKVGKNKMVNWKATVRTWEKRDFNQPNQTKKQDETWCQPPEDDIKLPF